MKQGKLIVVSAPSGCGKTTIIEHLLKRNRGLKRSISYTTRSPRQGERDGRDYFFVSKKGFLGKRKKGFFLESARVFGHWYGTSKAFVKGELRAGADLVLAIDVQGMRQLKSKAGREIPMISIFIMPPSLRVLRMRLAKRKTESHAEITRRLKVARKEIAARSLYDFVVVNRKVDKAVNEIEDIVT